MVETQTKHNTFWLWNDAIDFQKRGDVAYWLPASFSAATAHLSYKLSDVAKLSDLRFNPSQNPEDKFFYIDISNINTSDGSYEKTEIRNAYAPSRARKKLERFDVIVSTVRPNRNATSLILEDANDLVCSTGFAVLKAMKVNPFYLFVFTKTSYFIDQLVRQTSATMYPAVNENDVLNVGVFIPSEKDQQGIEKIVKEIFRLKQEAEGEYREAVNLLESLIKFDSEHLKTFMRWSNEIDFIERLDFGYWRQQKTDIKGKRLNEVASINTGKQYEVYESINKGIEYISIKDFENLFVKEADRFVLPNEVLEKTEIVRGDVLLAVTGATIGKVGIFNREQGVVSADVAIIRSKKLDPYFVGALIQSKYGKAIIDKYTYGATNKHLDIRGFSENFVVPQVDGQTANKIGELFKQSAEHREESRRKLQEAKKVVEDLITK